MKQSGLGQKLYVDGVAWASDVGALTAGATRASQNVTGMDKEAEERIQSLADGMMDVDGFFNPTGLHTSLKDVPIGNRVCTWLLGTAQGDGEASLTAVQLGHDQSRGTDGFVSVKANSEGSYGVPLTFGNQLTADTDTFTTQAGQATSSYDFAVASTGGWFTVHCTAFTGTTATVKLEDSADDSTWADVDASASTVFTGIGAARIALASSVGVARYVRGYVSGTFTTLDLLITFCPGDPA